MVRPSFTSVYLRWPALIGLGLVALAAGNMEKGRPTEPKAELAAGTLPLLRRTVNEIMGDRVLAVSAGVTFYGLLAIFPALAALVSLYGLFADRHAVLSHVETLKGFLPEGAVTVIGDQMRRIADGTGAGLGVAAVAGLLVALWSTNAGTKAMIEALNIAYDVEDRRSYVRYTLQSLLMTLGGLVTLILLIGAVAVIPAMLGLFLVSGAVDWVLWAGRWPLVFVALLLGLGVLYRYGPDRREAHWQWITPGSLTASLGLLAFSMLFSWYAANFGNYNETYGSLGAVMVFLTWLWLSIAIVISGAELNAEVERKV